MSEKLVERFCSLINKIGQDSFVHCKGSHRIDSSDDIFELSSVSEIRALMEHVGLWDEFVHDLFRRGKFFQNIGHPDNAPKNVSDILTDPTLLIQACISFMEGGR